MFPCMFEALAHAAGYKVSATGDSLRALAMCLLEPVGASLGPELIENITCIAYTRSSIQ